MRSPLVLALLSAAVLVLSSTTFVNAQVNCMATPSDPSCATYTMPSDQVSTDITNLCKQMPFMPGCSVYDTCTSLSKADEWCLPFSILADICAIDMPMMKDCSNYVSMCGSFIKNGTTAPQQCSTQPMIHSLPTTKLASSDVISICTEMDMVGCEKCPKPAPGAYAADCDTLTVYSSLCKSMPEMNQCGDWKKMCSSTSDSQNLLHFDTSSYCAAGVGNADQDPPAMRMFFHFGFSDYVLFKEWVPRTGGQYAATWFGLFFLTLIYQAIATYHITLEAKWMELRAVELQDIKTGSWVQEWRRSWSSQEIQQNIVRFWLTFVETTLGYALMLVTMTFNVPLYFAVILGLSVGSVLFSRQKNLAGGVNKASNSGCAGCG